MKSFKRRWFLGALLMGVGVAAGANSGLSQDILASTCNSGQSNPPACNQANVRGDRAEGWLAQGRSEVMAQ
jgi:hypothetical protein